MKNRGITLAILYIPYQPIQNRRTFASSEDFAGQRHYPVDSGHAAALCLAELLFTANSPQDIVTALSTMFAQSLVTAHVTN